MKKDKAITLDQLYIEQTKHDPDHAARRDVPGRFGVRLDIPFE